MNVMTCSLLSIASKINITLFLQLIIGFWQVLVQFRCWGLQKSQQTRALSSLAACFVLTPKMFSGNTIKQFFCSFKGGLLLFLPKHLEGRLKERRYNSNTEELVINKMKIMYQGNTYLLLVECEVRSIQQGKNIQEEETPATSPNDATLSDKLDKGTTQIWYPKEDIHQNRLKTFQCFGRKTSSNQMP